MFQEENKDKDLKTCANIQLIDYSTFSLHCELTAVGDEVHLALVCLVCAKVIQ